VQRAFNVSALLNGKKVFVYLEGKLMITVLRLKQSLIDFVKVAHNNSVEQEDRYWGVESALERLEGRVVREGYYGSEVWEASSADERGREETSAGSLGSWREEVERARSESVVAYEKFLDLLHFYYAENRREAEMGTREG
jgi:hypothetical protein